MSPGGSPLGWYCHHAARDTTPDLPMASAIDNHRPDALHFGFYNFCQRHGSLRVAPAMGAGITDRVWDVKELLA
jgi:hypothetical protein